MDHPECEDCGELKVPCNTCPGGKYYCVSDDCDAYRCDHLSNLTHNIRLAVSGSTSVPYPGITKPCEEEKEKEKESPNAPSSASGDKAPSEVPTIPRGPAVKWDADSSPKCNKVA
jgi:hypothetical protein